MGGGTCAVAEGISSAYVKEARHIFDMPDRSRPTRCIPIHLISTRDLELLYTRQTARGQVLLLSTTNMNLDKYKVARDDPMSRIPWLTRGARRHKLKTTQWSERGKTLWAPLLRRGLWVCLSQKGEKRRIRGGLSTYTNCITKSQRILNIVTY